MVAFLGKESTTIPPRPQLRRLGPYHVLERLGAGGMGEVYRATDPRLGRDVAIKLLPEHIATDPRALERFERETRAVAALSHPNVLVIHDVGQEETVHYAVVELLEGETLAARLARGSLPWRQVVELGAAVADGLAATHARGIVHRDIKPANLFLTGSGWIKILDFGIVAPAPDPSTPASGPTRPGLVFGTPGYASPEQARGEPVDARSDLFSLGCVLYEMLGGQRAFERKGSMVALLGTVVEENPTPLAELAPEAPQLLIEVVERCLEKRREERFVSASDLALALRGVVHTIDTPAASSRAVRVPSRLQPPFRRWLSRLARWLGFGETAPRSLAVLPFVNVTGDPTTEYLSDGISESVIRSLSRVEGLQVLAWGTVTRFKGRMVSPDRVGLELGVEAVLTGRVLEREGRLAVSVELVETSSGECLLGERWDRLAADIFEVQEEMARDIVDRLRRGLTEGQELGHGPPPSRDPKAYRLYLKGRYLWNRRTRDGLQRSVGFFREAIERDEGYALAWSGLADAYNVQPFWGILPPLEAFPQGRTAAETALELQPDLAEGHVSLAYSLFYFTWDRRGAERHFRRALALNPNSVTAHHWYGVCLALAGLGDRALSELRRAREIDPLSLMVNADLALVHHLGGDDPAAVDQCHAVLELDPAFAPAHLYLGMALEQLGRPDDAVAQLERAVELSPGGTAALSALGHVLTAAGREHEACCVLEELGARAKDSYVSPYLLGVLHAGLGELDQAFDWLRRAQRERCEMMVWVERDPRLRPLRSDPRYRELVRAINSETTTGQPTTIPG